MYLDSIKTSLPIALWGFDATSVSDASGNGHDISLGSNTLTTPLVPDDGWAAVVSSPITLPDLNTLKHGNCTIDVWVRPQSQPGGIVTRGTDGIFLESNGVTVVTGEQKHFGVVTNMNRRLHLVVTIGESVAVYVDGERIVNELTQANFAGSGSLVLGSVPVIVDGMSIYNRILSDEEIDSHYQSGMDFVTVDELAPALKADHVSLIDSNATLADRTDFDTDWSAGDADNVDTTDGLSLDPVPDLEVIAQSPNMVTDPSFESSKAGFVTTGAGHEVTLDSTHVRSGSQSLRIDRTGGTGAVTWGAYWSLSGAALDAMKPDTEYTFSAWVYIPSGNTVEGLYNDVRVGGAMVAEAASGVPATEFDKWVQVSVTVTTLPDITGTHFVLYLYGSGTDGESVWFDDLCLNEGSRPRDSFYDYSRNNLSESDSMLTDMSGWSSTHDTELEDGGLFGSNCIHVQPGDDSLCLSNATEVAATDFVTAYVQVIQGDINDFSWDGDSVTMVEQHGDWYRLIGQGNLNLMVDNANVTEFLFTAPQVESGDYFTAFTSGGQTAAVATVVLT